MLLISPLLELAIPKTQSNPKSNLPIRLTQQNQPANSKKKWTKIYINIYTSCSSLVTDNVELNSKFGALHQDLQELKASQDRMSNQLT